MTDIQIVMFCTAVIAISACVMHHSTKTISAMLYRRMVTGEIEPAKPPKEKPKSPYGMIHTMSSKNSWGYCITKNGEIYRSSKYASAPVYSCVSDAQKVINVYEELEGYKLTVLGGNRE